MEGILFVKREFNDLLGRVWADLRNATVAYMEVYVVREYTYYVLVDGDRLLIFKIFGLCQIFG